MSRYSQRGRRPSYAGKFVLLHLACNDPDNGSFAGTLCGFQIERAGEQIDFEFCGMREPRLTLLAGDRFRLFRHIHAFRNMKEWYGSWVWNVCTIAVPDAAAIIVRALKRDFSVDGARGDSACSLIELLDMKIDAPLVEAALVGFGTKRAG